MQNQPLTDNPFDDLLILAAHPYRGIQDLYKQALKRALEFSDAQIAMAIITPSGWLVEGNTPPGFKSTITLDALKKAWQEPRGWTETTRREAERWLADLPQTSPIPYLMVRAAGDQASHASPFDLLARSASALWLPLANGEATLAWIGIGAQRHWAFSAERLRALERLSAPLADAFSRLQMREHARKNGIDVNWIGRSPGFLELEEKLRQTSRHSRTPVLIQGERGSGKELAAYAVHFFSERNNQPFVPVLAPALTETLQVDELFGHERNSYTGANTFRKGKFLAANGGTLFLDEVADLPLSLQAALLRVFDHGEIQPIGRDLPIRVDVRIVAATNKNLEKAVEDGRFRADLYDRLNVLRITVPPLRERVEDIPVLAKHFMLSQCIEMNKRKSFDQPSICHLCDSEMEVGCATEEFYQMLKGYSWPGNVRELRNLITRMTAVSVNEVLSHRHLPLLFSEDMPSQAQALAEEASLTLDAIVRAHIEKVLEITENNQTHAARMLGIARTTLQSKMKKLGVPTN
ncbi:MAG: two-component system, NtrC family, response regulator HydG [Blastocatellia bacterium]